MKAEPTDPNRAPSRSLLELKSESAVFVSLNGSLGCGFGDHRERDAFARAVDHYASDHSLLRCRKRRTQQAENCGAAQMQVLRPHEGSMTPEGRVGKPARLSLLDYSLIIRL